MPKTESFGSGYPSLRVYYVPQSDVDFNPGAAFFSAFLAQRTPWTNALFQQRLAAQDPEQERAALREIAGMKEAEAQKRAAFDQAIIQAESAPGGSADMKEILRMVTPLISAQGAIQSGDLASSKGGREEAERKATVVPVEGWGQALNSLQAEVGGGDDARIADALAQVHQTLQESGVDPNTQQYVDYSRQVRSVVGLDAAGLQDPARAHTANALSDFSATSAGSLPSVGVDTSGLRGTAAFLQDMIRRGYTDGPSPEDRAKHVADLRKAEAKRRAGADARIRTYADQLADMVENPRIGKIGDDVMDIGRQRSRIRDAVPSEPDDFDDLLSPEVSAPEAEVEEPKKEEEAPKDVGKEPAIRVGKRKEVEEVEEEVDDLDTFVGPQLPEGDPLAVEDIMAPIEHSETADLLEAQRKERAAAQELRGRLKAVPGQVREHVSDFVTGPPPTPSMGFSQKVAEGGLKLGARGLVAAAEMAQGKFATTLGGESQSPNNIELVLRADGFPPGRGDATKQLARQNLESLSNFEWMVVFREAKKKLEE